MKGEASGSTKFFSEKFKSLKSKIKRKKDKIKELGKDGDANLESSGKKFSSNGSLVSQANGVKSGSKQNVKGEQHQIFVMNPDTSLLNNDRSMNSKELQSHAVAENNQIDTVEFVIPMQNVRDTDNGKSISTPPTLPCEIVPLLSHTQNTFTEIDKHTPHIDTHTTTKKQDPDYLQPPSRGIDEFVSDEKGSCFTISNKKQGKVNYHFSLAILFLSLLF